MPPKTPPGVPWSWIACAILALAAPAGAAASHQRTGGAAPPSRPVVAKLACNEGSPRCARGETLTVTGASLDGARMVTFLGRRGRRDDRRARPRVREAHLLTVRVPAGARSGPIRVTGRSGSTRPRTRVVIARARARSGGAADDGDTLHAGGPPRSFRYRAPAAAAAAGATVQAARVSDGAVVAAWPVAPGADGSGELSWDGTQGGVPVPVGRYAFSVVGPGAAAVSAEPGAGAPFDVLDAIFPIRGRHEIGRATTNRFGGGRGHQGHDVFARCGTRLVAARGGVVAFAGRHARAGNYVVVTGADGQGYAYMHMRRPSPLRAGERVLTGQTIGEVGDSGRASGCHLHFELWTPPGWQRGAPVDPLPELRRWDAFG